MRCAACDVRLTAREATRKGEASGQYLDLCDKCFGTIAEFIGAEDSAINAGDTEGDSEEQDQSATDHDLGL